MNKGGPEKRLFARYPVKGATLQYQKDRTCLVVNISRGGICFLSQESLKVSSLITMKISFPGPLPSLTLKGQVCWCLPGLAHSDEYQVGVRFLPFENKKGSNPPRLLERIIKLET